MEYGRFVRTRTAIWDAFEAGLARVRAGMAKAGYDEIEGLALRYRQVLHDHALAAARWPETATARRLRRLAVEGTHALRWDRQDRLARPGRFLSHAFPTAFARLRPHVGVAGALFIMAALFGFALGVAQPATGLALLGPAAVEGLREGRLWTETLTRVSPQAASSGIAANNMGVALTAFAGGALAGLGALYVVLMNGFHLGAIVAATLHYGMAPRLLEFVSAHGPLELSLVVITAGAGLRVGHALVAPDDGPRAAALTTAGRDALVVLLGSLPWFLALGLVEGYVSPSPLLPVSLKVGLGLALLATYLVAALSPVRQEAP